MRRQTAETENRSVSGTVSLIVKIDPARRRDLVATVGVLSVFALVFAGARFLVRSTGPSTAMGGAFLLAMIATLPLVSAYLIVRRRSIAVDSIIDRVRASIHSGGEAEILQPGLSRDHAILALLLDELRVGFRSQIKGFERNRIAISRVLDALGEGLVAIDVDGKVTLSNRRVAEIFGIGQVAAGKSLVEVVRNAKLLAAFDDALDGKDVAERLTVDLDGAPRVIEIRAFPVEQSPDIAAVALLIDVTRIEQLEKTRREFVADFSHEVRTPLAGIGSAIESLDFKEISEDDEDQLRRIILRQVERLERLVRDLAELNEIESGGIALELENVDLFVLAREVAEQAHGRDGSVEVKGESVVARVDSFRIEQVMTNLIENAIKHGGTGKAFVEVRDDGDHAVVSVIDEGPGIPDPELDKIFHRLYRVDRSRAREIAGSGLGLAISKHLVRLHGGTISARSGGDEGTVFKVRLPKGA